MVNALLVIMCIIVIVVLYLLATYNRSTYENYLTGYWMADGDDFCEQSEIAFMLIYIAPHDGLFTKTRECYIVIGDDICNQPFVMSYQSGWAWVNLGTYHVNADLQMEDNVMNDHVEICVDMTTGELIIRDDDKLYAKLHKNHEITNLTKRI